MRCPISGNLIINSHQTIISHAENVSYSIKRTGKELLELFIVSKFFQGNLHSNSTVIANHWYNNFEKNFQHDCMYGYSYFLYIIVNQIK